MAAVIYLDWTAIRIQRDRQPAAWLPVQSRLGPVWSLSSSIKVMRAVAAPSGWLNSTVPSAVAAAAPPAANGVAARGRVPGLQLPYHNPQWLVIVGCFVFEEGERNFQGLGWDH